MEEFSRLNAGAKERRQSITESLSDAIGKNLPVNQWIVDRVMGDSKIDPADKEALIELYQSGVRDVEMAAPDIIRQLNEDLELSKRD